MQGAFSSGPVAPQVKHLFMIRQGYSQEISQAVFKVRQRVEIRSRAHPSVCSVPRYLSLLRFLMHESPQYFSQDTKCRVSHCRGKGSYIRANSIAPRCVWFKLFS